MTLTRRSDKDGCAELDKGEGITSHRLAMTDTLIGNRVMARRQSLDLSRAELADRVRLSVQIIANLERGATAFDVARLTRMAAGLGVSVADLMTDLLAAPEGGTPR